MEIKNNKTKLKITPELARLHAHVCGDGCIYQNKTNRSRRELLQHPRKITVRNRFHVEYWNNDVGLLQQFIADLKRVFVRSGCLDFKRNRVNAQGKRVYVVLKSLGAGKSHEWFISDEIISGSKKVRIEWIKSFFDDEAYVPLKKKRIEVNCVNKKGLYQIKKMLYSLGIISIIRGPYWYNGFYIYRLCINSKDIWKYHKIIGFNSLKKKMRLLSLVE